MTRQQSFSQQPQYSYKDGYRSRPQAHKGNQDASWDSRSSGGRPPDIGPNQPKSSKQTGSVPSGSSVEDLNFNGLEAPATGF